MNYGTWTTLDCPAKESNMELCEKKLDELCAKKEKKAPKVDNSIYIAFRKIMNPHDSGSYPSFELDCNVNEKYDEDEINDSDDNSGDYEKREKIIEILNELELEYCDYMNTLDD